MRSFLAKHRLSRFRFTIWRGCHGLLGHKAAHGAVIYTQLLDNVGGRGVRSPFARRRFRQRLPADLRRHILQPTEEAVSAGTRCAE